jgi:hypothetical protein
MHLVDHAVRVALIDGAGARVAALECYAIDQEPALRGHTNPKNGAHCFCGAQR